MGTFKRPDAPNGGEDPRRHGKMDDDTPYPERLIGQTDRLQTLNEIGRVVSSTLDLNTLYDTIYQQVGRVMDTEHFFIALYRPERNVLDVPYLREEGVLFVDQVIPWGNSVTSLVIQRGTPVLFDSDEEYTAYADEHGLQPGFVGDKETESKVWVPLNTGERTIGAMTAQSTRRHAYTLDDEQTLSVIASQAAVAIVNARLYEQSQANVRQMQALLQVARTVNSALDLQAVLDAILGGMQDVVPFFVAGVLLPNHATGFLDIAGTVGPRAEERKRVMRVPFGSGVTGTAFRSGEPVIVPNVRAFPGYIPGHERVESELALPLKRGDQVVGVLYLERDEPDAFSEEDLALLSIFASQAAIAIENARLYEEQQRRVHELQTIESIVQKLTPLHEIPVIASVINTELRRLIDYHACRIFFLDQAHQVLRPVRFPGSDKVEHRLRLGEGLAGWIALHGESVILPNSLVDPRVSQIPGTPRREESIMGAPLVFEDRVQGVITLSKLGVAQFDENAVRLLEIVAGQAAIVFDRARLYDELRTEAITDPLTKLSNRRYLIERLREEQARAQRSEHDLAAIMLDLDSFKAVNDQYGHDAGDAVLQAVAQVIRQVVRTEDIVARYGGEEFCVLLPEIEAGEAERVAERLRNRIERTRMPDEAGISRVTVSVGVAHRAAADRATELFSRADAAMYQAKHQGGNAVYVADGSEVRSLAWMA